MQETDRAKDKDRVQELKDLIEASLHNVKLESGLRDLSSYSPEEYFGIVDEPIARQLEIMFRSYDQPTQDDFRKAVVLAASEWNPDDHGPTMTAELAFLAADTKAFEAAPHLINIVESKLIQRRDEEEFELPLRAVIGVVGGFAIYGDAETKND